MEKISRNKQGKNDTERRKGGGNKEVWGKMDKG